MSHVRQASVPRPRMLAHPGRADPVRIRSLASPTARHVRLWMPEGASLFEGIVRPLAERGIRNASLTILGGYCSKVSYCVAPPDTTGKAVIAYSKPIDTGAAWLVFGNATLGRSMKGDAIVHCHAAMRTEAGPLKGGHLLTEACIIGSGGISALVTSLDGFTLQQAYDPETNIPLLQPSAEVPDAA